MTLEAQRIAIAEACGWEFYPSRDVAGKAVPESWRNPDGFEFFEDMPLPNYLHDLNAMHEAEKTLNEKQQLDYGNHVMDVCDRETSVCATSFALFHATAAQRAEAFLRTLGKWTDDDVTK